MGLVQLPLHLVERSLWYWWEQDKANTSVYKIVNNPQINEDLPVIWFSNVDILPNSSSSINSGTKEALFYNYFFLRVNFHVDSPVLNHDCTHAAAFAARTVMSVSPWPLRPVIFIRLVGNIYRWVFQLPVEFGQK